MFGRNESPPPPEADASLKLDFARRRVSLDLGPPPSTDLEQIHATSSQAPGLTTFSLGSPPPRNAEQLSFNKIYSRVKSIAGAMKDAVGATGSVASSPAKSFSGSFGDQYHRNAASRDSVISTNTEGGSDTKSPTKSQISHLRDAPKASRSRSSSRVSSHCSITSDFAPPPAIRKVALLASVPRTTTNPSLAPVTVFRDGAETPAEGALSQSPSRQGSPSHLVSQFVDAAQDAQPPAASTLTGAVGDSTFGSATNLTRSTSNAKEGITTVSGAVPATRELDNPYVDVDEEDDSASDETLSDTSDDDVVMLHSKLPAGTGRGRSKKPAPPADNLRSKTKSTAAAQSFQPLKQATKSSNGTNAKEKTRPPSTTIGSLGTDDSNTVTPGFTDGPIPTIANAPQSEQTPGAQTSGPTLSLGSRVESAISLAPSTASTGTNQSIMKRLPLVTRPGADRSLLQGFRFRGDRSSDADSSVVGAAQGSATTGGTSSVNPSASREINDPSAQKSASGMHSGGLTGNTEAVSLALRQLRMGNLTKDFWMKDELCKDCFLCSATFSAWRRKHHCRLCGQIFCSKCTTLISGDKFGHQGSMRVCGRCLDVVSHIQDESDSDDFSPLAVYGKTKARDPSKPEIPASPGGYNMPKGLRPRQTPLMAIPATRMTAANNPNRRSQILEIDADLPSPPRPGSSRSVQALSRPVTAGSTKALGSSAMHHHTHHKHTRSHHRLTGYSNTDERIPFHRHPEAKRQLNSAFHADNILDPDLAPYMSDDDLSGEEQLSIFTTIASPTLNSDSTPSAATPMGINVPDKRIEGSSATSARARRAKSISRGSISGINAILGDSKIGHSRSSRHRSQSFMPPLQRPGTRGKSSRIMRTINDAVAGHSPLPIPSSFGAASPRVARGSSARGPLAPNIELNTASLEHVKKLLRQLLEDYEISDVSQWEKALIPILLKSTDDLNPDVRAGDSIDIRHYVKVKRIPGGKPTDTSYVSGVVFAKNLALKCMPRSIPHPRVVVISFPIEYQRHQMQFMSLDPVITQEKEFLQNLVNRIAALRPSLLLVQSNVSGLALQLLAKADIATAYNVKPSAIEAVARCAQADIYTSIDKLALSSFRTGRCDSFDVKTYVSEAIPGRKKTFMLLSGCQKELGCTIVLRGADMDILAILKQITELMVYVVYNLKLETCLMRDEFVVIPAAPTGPVAQSPPDSKPEAEVKQIADGVSVENPKESGTELQDSGTEGVTVPLKVDETGQAKPPVTLPEDRLPDDIPLPTFYEDIVRKHETKILSASPFVSYIQPYLLMRARNLERRLTYLHRLRDSLPPHEEERPSTDPEKAALEAGLQKSAESNGTIDPEKQGVGEAPSSTPEQSKIEEKFQLVDPEAVHGDNVKSGTRKSQEVLRAIYDAEYDKVLHVYETQKKQWKSYLSQHPDPFDPFAHQSITVLYSMVCTVTTVPCEGPELRRLEFYEQDDWLSGRSDCTLGQFVEHLVHTKGEICDSLSCDRTMIDHHRSYVHGQARVSVLVSDDIECPIQGMQNTILMWSYCKKCPNANTPAMPMSESSWKYSFGKYLELAFWSSDMKMRSGNCPHDLNKDHVRCFGYLGSTVVFQYDMIDLLEIVVPRTKITFKPEIDLRVKNEQYTQNEEKIMKYFDTVKARLTGINIETVAADLQGECQRDLEVLRKKTQDDQSFLIGKLQEKYNMSKYYEIVPLNRALRAMQEKVVEWDNIFASFACKYFPSEKDIRRLATLQLKRLFLDNNTPTPSLQSENDATPTQEKEFATSKIASADGVNTPDTSTLNTPVGPGFPPEEACEVLASVVEEDQEKLKEDEQSSIVEPSLKSDNASQHTTNTDPASSQELTPLRATPNDDATPKQEDKKLIDPEGLKSSPSLHPTSLPTTPVGGTPPRNKSSPEIMKAPGEETLTKAELQERTAARLTAGLPRPPSGIPVADPKRIRPRPPPILNRTVSQPEVPRRKDFVGNSFGFERRSPTFTLKKSSQDVPRVMGKVTEKLKAERKDKFRLSSLTKKPKERESQIPRSIHTGPKRRDTKVSTLTRHWEQLSKEFERERARNQQLAARRARALPVASSKPIVEVYRNAKEAVEEASDDEEQPKPAPTRDTSALTESSDGTFKTISPILSRNETATTADEQTKEPATPNEPIATTGSQTQSDVDASDGELSMTSDHEALPVPPNISDVLTPNESQLDLKLELPVQHKSAWVKMLTNFWAERSTSGWSPLEYPLHPTDHVFHDSDIIVREDEPSSLIAFALNGPDYKNKLQMIHNSGYSSMGHPTSGDDSASCNLPGPQHPELERSLLKTTGTHLKYFFQEGSAKMICKIFYAEQFDALRRNCGIADRYVESLSRCTKWDSKGGKSRSVFLKSQDERIVLKSLSPIETNAFIKFAPAYFQFMSEAFFRELPTVIAKMLGFYQILIKNPATGTEIKWDILVMENLFYDRKTTKIFDLKGSMRNRYTQSTGEKNEVLLDENMVEYIYESPLFVREHSKKLIRASLWNDTLFLSRQDVMDYSLMIGIDEDRKELVVGIIDCIRTYTWDKKLESWVKEKGLVGGGRNKPTVTSPREYKHRFREAMERYVLEAPSCWHLSLGYLGALQGKGQAEEVVRD